MNLRLATNFWEFNFSHKRKPTPICREDEEL